jgi:hypothetical protein
VTAALEAALEAGPGDVARGSARMNQDFMAGYAGTDGQ